MKKLIYYLSFLAFTFSSCNDSEKQNTVTEKDTANDTIKSVEPKDEKPHIIYSNASEGCEKNSWSPEVYTLYGDESTINKKLENSEMDLSNRRLYLVAIESEEGASIKLFEKSKEGNVEVKQWEGKDASQFISEASKNILLNKGVACVGEQTEALFNKLNPKNLGDIPAPVSAQAAFSHDIKSNIDKYLKVTIFLLC